MAATVIRVLKEKPCDEELELEFEDFASNNMDILFFILYSPLILLLNLIV